MKMNKLAMPGVVLFVSLLVSCGGGSDAPSDPPKDPPKDPIAAVTSCTPTADDSQPGLFIKGRIRSHQNGTQVYHKIDAVRYDSLYNPISIDYMVHFPASSAKALLVLIPGGGGDALLEGIDGNPATKSGGNFLIRSAHLYAAQGYKVVSVNRPSDYLVYLGYDNYRTSVNHAIDLSTIINAANTDKLPVIIAGTSRGTISAMAQQALADALALSSSLTVGDIAVKEVASIDSLKPSLMKLPVHVMWHVDDACDVTPPANSEKLVTDFEPDAANNPISGGFNADDGTACNGDSYHGFYGIETCAVGQETTWMNGLSLPVSHPLADSQHIPNVVKNSTITISLSALTKPATPGAKLSYSLPFGKTAQAGTVTLDGDTVTYTAPDWFDTTDKFVYVVHEEGGGSSHQVISLDLIFPI